MNLSAGTKLGPYQIAALLGAGGMGDVYRARDLRLDREVAIKVLRVDEPASAEMRARFEREGRTISQLNHPNICILFDAGREKNVDYLVMELLEGETLARRLDRGSLPIDEAVRIAIEIADAMERAHIAGITHRDLKPSNVMITKSGAKLLDFGLAKSFQPKRVVEDLEQASTRSASLTSEGVVVGTPQFMAPEILEQREVDHRADVWAFGCLVYQMITGSQPFNGESRASLTASILREEPKPPSEFRTLPLGLERTILQCLAKDPGERWQHFGDLRRELQWIERFHGRKDATAPRLEASSLRRQWPQAVIWALSGLALLIAGAVILQSTSIGHPRHPTHLFMLGPDEAVLSDDASNIAVSPDGRAIAFAANDSAGISQLWIRPLDSPESRVVPGSEGAGLPFWSPDGQNVAFFAESELKRVSRSGDRMTTLCSARGARGGAWSPRGQIVYSLVRNPLMQVAARGGTPSKVAMADTDGDSERRCPRFLPDGVHFLFLRIRGTERTNLVGSIDSPALKVVQRDAEGALTYANGEVLFLLRGALMRQRFDASKQQLVGEPRVLWLYSGHWTGLAGYPEVSVSNTGVLVERARRDPPLELTWMDNDGRWIRRVPAPAGLFTDLAVSPDGKRAAMLRVIGRAKEVWIVNLERGTGGPIPVELAGPSGPIWSEDSKSIVVGAGNPPEQFVYRIRAEDGGAQRLARLNDFGDWPIPGQNFGHHLIIRSLSPETSEDLMIWPAGRDSAVAPLFNSRYNETNGTASPDGRWVAYLSDETGRRELFVQALPNGGSKRQLSTQGAEAPSLKCVMWTHDGTQILFWRKSLSELAAIPVEVGGALRVGRERPLFSLPPDCGDLVPMPDGRGFLGLRETRGKDRGALYVVENWMATPDEGK